MKTFIVFLIVSFYIFVNEVMGQSNTSSDLSFTPNPPTCFGNNDGFIIIENANTSKTYIHQARNINTSVLKPSDSSPANTISGLSAGEYVVLSQCSDPNGQIEKFTSETVIVPEGSKLEITDCRILSKPSSQFPNKGMILLKIGGGVAPYTINQISSNENQQRGSFSNSSVQLNELNNNVYIFNVTDKNNCQVISEPIQMPMDNGLIVNPKINYPDCVRITGEIDFCLSNGTTPYTISYQNIETGLTISKEFLNDGNTSIEIPEYGQYDITITDASSPQKVDNSIKVRFAKPDCSLSISVEDVSKPTINKTKGGKVKVTIGNGTLDYSVKLTKEGEKPIQNNYTYNEFPIDSLTQGDYVIYVEDSRGVKGWQHFVINPEYETPEKSRETAKIKYNRFLNTYCQIEIKRKRVKSTQTWLSLGWTMLSGTSSLLTSGTTQLLTIGLNAAGNGILVFTNIDNIEALTRASQLMKDNLNVEFFDSHYYLGWDYDSYVKLLNELKKLDKIQNAAINIDKMPELKEYPEKVKIRKVPEYSKYIITN